MGFRFKIGKRKDQELDPVAELGQEPADELFADTNDDDLELVGSDVAESDAAETEHEPVTSFGDEPDQQDLYLADLNVAESDEAEAELEPVTSFGDEPDQQDLYLTDLNVAESDEAETEHEPVTSFGGEPDQQDLYPTDIHVTQSDEAEAGLEPVTSFGDPPDQQDLNLADLNVAESDEAETEHEPVTSFGDPPDQQDLNLADLNFAESNEAEAELEPVTSFGGPPDQQDLNLAGLNVAESNEAEAELEPVTSFGGPPDQQDLNLAGLNFAESNEAEEEIEPVTSFGDGLNQHSLNLADLNVAESDESDAELEPVTSFGDGLNQHSLNLADLNVAEFGTEDHFGNAEFHNPVEAQDKALNWVNLASILRRIHIPKVRLPKLPSNKRIVTLTTEKDSFRVVVFKGAKVKAWGSASFSTATSRPEEAQERPESDDLPSAEEVTETPLQVLLNDLSISKSNGVWRLLGKVGIRRSRVLMDLSLYTTLMRNIQIPRVRGHYLEPVVLAEVLDSLPFSKDEVDIFWRAQKDSETHSIFAVALPKKRLDSQVNTAKEAGLHPAAAYSKAVALALSSGVPNGVVVHLEADETALVLVQSGEAKTVHQLEFGQAESTAEARATSVSRAIEQVASYYQPDNPNEKNQPIPVILTGQCEEGNPVAQLLRSRLPREVLSMEPSLRYSEDFPLEEYAINLGLYLADRGGNTHSQTSESAKASPLNLLPKRHLPQPVPVLQTAVFLILALLIIQLYNVLGRVDVEIAEKEVLTLELRSLQELEQESDSVFTEYAASRTSNEVTQERIDELESQVDTLDQELSSLLAQLRVITGPAMPRGVKLTAVAPLGKDFTLLGSAGNHAETLQYITNLKDSELFSDARVQRVSGEGGADPESVGTVSFQIKVFHLLPADPEEEESTTGGNGQD